MNFTIAAEMRRKLREVKSAIGPEIIIDGKRAINLASNDYLGLANHPKLKEAAKRAIDEYGAGAPASRIICGNNTLYKTLEEKLAGFENTERALVFASGYAANLGTISALVSRDDVVFSDRLNHASIVDAITLSRAKLRRYPHKDTTALEEMLKDSESRTKLIVTDTVFSMDGDVAPLEEISALAKRYGAMLMVDEAHAAGVLGKTGAGALEHFGIKDGAHPRFRGDIIQMGTFSKAFGGLGGFVCASEDVIEYLMNKARALIYSTALPPSVLASNIAALEIIQAQPELRSRLWENAGYFRSELERMGFDTLQSETPIIPVLLKENGLAVKFGNALFDEGIFAAGIRPPTVPLGEARLRISISAAHTEEHLEQALGAFAKVGRKFLAV